MKWTMIQGRYFYACTNFWLGPNNLIIVTGRLPVGFINVSSCNNPTRRKRILLGMPTRGPTIICCRAAGCIDSFWLLACSKERLQSLSIAGIWSHIMTSSMIIFLQVDYVNRCYWLIHAIYLLLLLLGRRASECIWKGEVEESWADSFRFSVWTRRTNLGYECLDCVSTSRPMQVASCKFADYIYIYMYLVGGFDPSEKY